MLEEIGLDLDKIKDLEPNVKRIKRAEKLRMMHLKKLLVSDAKTVLPAPDKKRKLVEGEGEEDIVKQMADMILHSTSV